MTKSEKCTLCQLNECGRKFANRAKCLGKKEEIECICTCQMSGADEMLAAAGSVGVGLLATAGGIVLSINTGGLFAVVGGAALIGAGSSLMINPIQKKIGGERMTLIDTAKETLLGASIGALTAPIGAVGVDLARGTSSAVKLGIQAGAGALAGGISSGANETAKALNGEEVSVGSFVKAISIGALAGTIGGASSQMAKVVSGEVAKEVTRTSMEMSTAAVGDVGLKLMERGTKPEHKRLILQTASQITVATTKSIARKISKCAETPEIDLRKFSFDVIRGDIDEAYDVVAHFELFCGQRSV